MAMETSYLDAVLVELKALGVPDGLHCMREKRLLWNLARAVSSGVIVEIGSFEGYSTIILAKALGDWGKVYAIDPHTGKISEADEEESPYCGHDTWPRLNEHIRQSSVSYAVSSLKLKSEEAEKGWDKPVGLLWIDGSHKYEDVKKDFSIWRKHLVPGGVVVFHDMWLSGPRKVIADHVLRDRQFGKFRFVPCCMFCATYLGDKPRQVSLGFVWRFLLDLRHAIEGRRTLRQWIKLMLRRV